jgi:hypothetical protein
MQGWRYRGLPDRMVEKKGGEENQETAVEVSQQAS